MRTVQKIQKELNESNCDYEITAAQKLHPDGSDEKRTSDFIVGIHAMINNDPN